MKKRQFLLSFFTLFIALLVSISNVLPVLATGEENDLPGENTQENTGEDQPQEDLTPTDDPQNEENPKVDEPKYYELKDALVGLKDEAYHTSIQFKEGEEGLVNYNVEVDEYSLTGFTNEEIPVSLTLYWEPKEEDNLEEYAGAVYTLPEDIQWEVESLTVYDEEGNKVEKPEGITLENNVLTLTNYSYKHLSMKGLVKEFEVEEKEDPTKEDNTTDDNKDEEDAANDIEQPKTETVITTITFSGIGKVNLERTITLKPAEMTLMRAPLLGAPSDNSNDACAGDPTPLMNVNIADHLVAKVDPNSAGVYAWIKLNGKQFTLNDHDHDYPELKEEIDKLPEELPDSTKNVEVYLSWRFDPKDYPGTVTKDTVFTYTLPEGINWERLEVDLVDLKDPDGRPAGKFKVEGRQIEATYSEAFLKRVYSACSSFTSYGTIEGSATMADWDDVGNEPYHFEGIGYFEPQVEEAVARIRTEKSIVKDTVEYLGNGKFLIQYRTDITGTHKIAGALGRLHNLKVTDTFDKNMSLPEVSIANYTLKSGSEDANDRLHNCRGNKEQNPEYFSCDIDYIDDKETLTLTYNLYLDINYTSEDPKPSPLSSATRTFENDVEVTADDPNDPDNKLKDTSFVIDTYSMKNPKKEGKPYLEAPEQVEWEIRYNVGKFDKASSGEFPGINLGGMFISDTMGPGQKYVDGTFVIETSQNGQTWIPLSGVTPTWEDKDQDGIKEYFSFTLPENDNVYDFIRIRYRSVSTNQNTSVTLTNTASIASDEEGTDEKSTDGEAPLVGPSTLPKIKKTGNATGPNGNFEWTTDITFYEDFSRDVRVYDAMEEGLILYPDTITIQRVIQRHATQAEIEDRTIDKYYQLKNGSFTLTKPTDETISNYKSDTAYVEELKEELVRGTDWEFEGSTTASDQHTYDRENPGAENNPPWLKANLDDSSYDWRILFKGNDSNIFPVAGYAYIDETTREDDDDRVVYRITYQTNAPLPGKDPEGKPVTKKFLNEAQVRVKSDDLTDTKDRYNTDNAELEKKYIEKESNDDVYKDVTGETVDTTHGYIGWFIRVYPLDTNGYVEITDKFSYSTQQTSMKLINDSLRVYVSTEKQKPTRADEIDKSLYTVSNSSTTGFTLRINSAPAAGITKDKYVYVFYQTRVDPRINNTSIRYTNTAELDRNGDKNYPPATASRSRTDVVISKTSKRNGPFVTYTLKINKELFNIDPKNGVLTIEDTRGASIEYVEGSMHFYDGSKYKDTDSAETKAEYELTGDPYSVTSNGHTISITIPDEKYVVIEYRAYITKKDGDLSGEDAENRAVIKGQSGFSVTNNLRGKVQRAKAGTSIDTDHPWIKIMKADKKTLKALKGVTFRFTAYTIDHETGELTPMEGEVYEVTSDENGTIWFTFDHEKGWMTYYDVVYEVQEIKAPKGYQLDPTKIYIVFADDYDYSEIDQFTINGKVVEVLIEEEQYLHRIDFPNVLEPTPTPTPKKPSTYVPVPNTGDTFHVGMWIGILAGAVVLMFLLLLYLRKNRKQ